MNSLLSSRFVRLPNRLAVLEQEIKKTDLVICHIFHSQWQKVHKQKEEEEEELRKVGCISSTIELLL